MDFGDEHGIYMLSTFIQANIYINLICFDRNLIIHGSECSHICPQKTVKKATTFSTKI